MTRKLFELGNMLSEGVLPNHGKTGLLLVGPPERKRY
jgi:hypothetical protein